MKTQDQILAKKLMYIRKTLADVKLERSRDEYRDMLDDVDDNYADVEHMESVSSICEVPSDRPLDDKLRHRGITKMHISSRRFSVLWRHDKPVMTSQIMA